MKVKSVKGSSKVSPNPPKGYESWVEYWDKNHGQILDPQIWYDCPACGKSIQRKIFDGCHVQKDGATDKKWYIIPLCDSCNHRKDTFDENGNLLLDVPSNLNVTYSE